jgi:hypothetical protein
MTNDKVKEYQENLPYLDDVELFNAAKIAIYIIVEKHGTKAASLKHIARKYKVKEAALKKHVEIAIPPIFFAERSKSAKKRYEKSFYKPPEVNFISGTQKESGLDNLRKIKEMLNKK